MLNNLVRPTIEEMIAQRRWTDLRESLEDWAAPELADLLMDVEKTDRVLLFRALPRPLSTEVFSYLEFQQQDELLLELTDGETRSLLANLAPDDRTDLLGELPSQVVQRLLNLLSPADLREARRLLGYPEESVGRLMTPDYVAVRSEWTIQQALDHIRMHGRRSETINRIYVTDSAGRLIDDVDLQSFILSDPRETVDSIMDNAFVSVSVFDDREDAVRAIRRYDLVALPVVDSDGVLVGIVTVDDLLDVAEEEATEDFHRVGSVEPLRMGYWEATMWTLYRTRIGWLAGLVLVNLVSGGVLHMYEETLQSVIALAFFMPLIIATGGNAGTQSATIIIRAISTGDVDLGEWRRAVLRELGIGLFLGLTLGVLGMGLGMFRGGWELGLVVFLTLVSMLLVTNLLGMSLPFIFARFGIDPAVASGPLVTSVADIIGLLIYFSIATWLLM
ncbi:MAG: magnesium transporter [Gemmatimonadetes bacterium]|jgi:magnesium transporter|nr:magnesium transporter [Gemmatimonadota bacterium]